MTENPRIILTSKTHTLGAPVAAVGPSALLEAAFNSGSPVTLSGKHGGEIVYLGFWQTDSDGIPYKRVGPDRPNWIHEGQEIAAYLVDMTRLDGAPRLDEINKQVQQERLDAAMQLEQRVAAEDARLENLAEDGA